MNLQESIRVEPYEMLPLRPRKVLRKTWGHSLATRLLSAALLKSGMLDSSEDGGGMTSSNAALPDVVQYVALASTIVFVHVGAGERSIATAIAADLYLLAASQGLACWPHECRRERLAERLGLDDPTRILFAQTVRLPASRGTAVQVGD
jgi:hypothetical protein